jgi:hypothetical protein
MRKLEREESLRAIRASMSAQCPFAGWRDDQKTTPAMRTYFNEYPSWDCPEMDPMSCGTWQVALVIEERKSMEKAA